MPSQLTSSMLSMNDAIHGWSPIGGDDEDVNVSPDLFFMTIQSFPSFSSTFLSPVCPPLNAATSQPCLPPAQLSQPRPQPQSHSVTTSAALPQRAVSHSPVASSSDRRAQRNRNRDPSWIPRPRNAFIIFRCEFSREHTQGSQESQNGEDDDNATVKTLSKRAAEAWKQLSASERERYKILADKEREEHARLYPHYRFRPMKRQVSSTRKTTSVTVETPKGARVPSMERPCMPLVHMPSVLASAPEIPSQNLSESIERAEEPAHTPEAPAPLPVLSTSSCPTETPEEIRTPLQLDFGDPLLFPTVFSSDSPPASFDLYTPLSSVSPDAFRCHDSAFDIDQNEDLEKTQALEAYAIGRHNLGLFSPFSFPEYY